MSLRVPSWLSSGRGLLLLALAVFGFLWFELINQLRVEWSVNPQYSYGWAVPFLCAYLLYERLRILKSAPPPSRPAAHRSRTTENSPPAPTDHRSPITDHSSSHPSTLNQKLSTSAAPSSVLSPPSSVIANATTDHCSLITDNSSPLPSAVPISASQRFSVSAFKNVSAFQHFSVFAFVLLAFLYAPTRLVQEANPEWRLVSWALALEVIGLTLIFLRLAACFSLYASIGERVQGEVSNSPISSTLNPQPSTSSPTVHRSPITDHSSSLVSAFQHFSVSTFLFPLLFFLVAVPWPTIIEGPLVQGLTRANAAITIELLGFFGVPAMQHGNVIEIATGVVGIDEACSGIRSFQATLMISLFFGELYRLGVLRRVLFVVAGFLMSFVFNIGRTSLLTWVASRKGIDAISTWHDPAGVTILVACFMGLWLLGQLLKRKHAVECGERARLGRPQPAPTPVGSATEKPIEREPNGNSNVVGEVPTTAPEAGALPGSPETSPGSTGASPVESGAPADFPVRRPASGIQYPALSPSAPPSSDLSNTDNCSPITDNSPPTFSFSAFQLFSFSKRLAFLLIALAVWLLFTNVGVEAWYRVHEANRPESVKWTVQLPRDNPTFRAVALPSKTMRMLRYDEAKNGLWQEPGGTRWQAIFLRWDPGRIAVHLAKSHTPEVCLTAAGNNPVPDPELNWIEVHGLDLPFQSYRVFEQGHAVHVYYCLWEDRAINQAFKTERLTYGNRLGPVLAGRRNSGQRSLEIALWGVDDPQAAEAALKRQLEKLIVVEKPGN